MYYIAHFDVYKIMPVYKKTKYDFYLVLYMGISTPLLWVRHCDSLHVVLCFPIVYLLFNKFTTPL